MMVLDTLTAVRLDNGDGDGDGVCCAARSLISAFNKVEDRVNYRKRSWVQSGSWSRDFTALLCESPLLRKVEIEARDGCEVCHRKDRVSRFRFTLSGPAYNSKHCNTRACYNNVRL